jgi:hypothetical protein
MILSFYLIVLFQISRIIFLFLIRRRFRPVPLLQCYKKIGNTIRRHIKLLKMLNLNNSTELMEKTIFKLIKLKKSCRNMIYFATIKESKCQFFFLHYFEDNFSTSSRSS